MNILTLLVKKIRCNYYFMNEKLDILNYKINLYFTKNVNLTSNLLLLPIINEEEGNNIFNLVKSKCSNNKLDNFIILTISNFSWNDDLSPYYQEDVLKNKYSSDFKGKGDIFLNKIVNDILPKVREYLFLKHNIKLSNIGIGGYSLAGLFALYSLYHPGLCEGDGGRGLSHALQRGAACDACGLRAVSDPPDR